MSKLKENRMKYFKIYKSKRDRAEQVIDNNPNNLRLLQTAKANLDKSWDDYSSSHFDFIVKEADEEGMADFEAEHDDLTSKNDEVVVLLEEKIDLLQTPEVVLWFCLLLRKVRRRRTKVFCFTRISCHLPIRLKKKLKRIYQRKLLRCLWMK